MTNKRNEENEKTAQNIQSTGMDSVTSNADFCVQNLQGDIMIFTLFVKRSFKWFKKGSIRANNMLTFFLINYPGETGYKAIPRRRIHLRNVERSKKSSQYIVSFASLNNNCSLWLLFREVRVEFQRNLLIYRIRKYSYYYENVQQRYIAEALQSGANSLAIADTRNSS